MKYVKFIFLLLFVSNGFSQGRFGAIVDTISAEINRTNWLTFFQNNSGSGSSDFPDSLDAQGDWRTTAAVPTAGDSTFLIRDGVISIADAGDFQVNLSDSLNIGSTPKSGLDLFNSQFDAKKASDSDSLGALPSSDYMLVADYPDSLDAQGDWRSTYSSPTTGDTMMVIRDGVIGVSDIGDLAGGGDFSNGGDTAGAARDIGNNDNFGLNVETNNLDRIIIENGGNIAMGPNADGENPVSSFEFYGTGAVLTRFRNDANTNGTFIQFSYEALTSTSAWFSYAGSGGIIVDNTNASVDGDYFFNIKDDNTTVRTVQFDDERNWQFGDNPGKPSTRGKVMVIEEDSSDPTSMPTNTAGIYVKAVSTVAELFVIDEADNASQISPHDPETNEYYYYSVNRTTGKVMRIDLERFFRDYDARHGTDYLRETTNNGELPHNRLEIKSKMVKK